MEMGIKCYVPECTNSVIGQCTGLPDEPCGHFYCEEHSKSKLCDECNVVNEARLLYQEYYDTAVEVDRINGRGWYIAFILLLGIVTLILSVMYSPWVIVPFIAIDIGIVIYMRYKCKLKLEKACQEYENFAEFYKEYKRYANRQQLAHAISGATDIVLGAMGETNAERDIRHIRNRLERMD